MPIYYFKHPKKEEYVEVIMSMTDTHEFTDFDGVKWIRVFTAPQITMTTKIDPFSARQYVDKTRGAKGNMGDLLDRSRELSEERKKLNGGVDPVQGKFFEDYAKRRHNKRHPQDPKRYEKLRKLGADIVQDIRRPKS